MKILLMISKHQSFNQSLEIIYQNKEIVKLLTSIKPISLLSDCLFQLTTDKKKSGRNFI